jgi:hypothetical protein
MIGCKVFFFFCLRRILVHPFLRVSALIIYDLSIPLSVGLHARQTISILPLVAAGASTEHTVLILMTVKEVINARRARYWCSLSLGRLRLRLPSSSRLLQPRRPRAQSIHDDAPTEYETNHRSRMDSR